MKKIKGKDLIDFVKRVLRVTFTNNLASLYSWEGRKGKRKLQHLETMNSMCSKFPKYFHETTDFNFFFIIKYVCIFQLQQCLHFEMLIN